MYVFNKTLYKLFSRMSSGGDRLVESANHEGGAMEEWGEEWGQGYKDNWYAKEHPKP